MRTFVQRVIDAKRWEDEDFRGRKQPKLRWEKRSDNEVKVTTRPKLRSKRTVLGQSSGNEDEETAEYFASFEEIAAESHIEETEKLRVDGKDEIFDNQSTAETELSDDESEEPSSSSSSSEESESDLEEL